MKRLMELSNSYPKNIIQEIKLRDLLRLREEAGRLKEIKTMFPPLEIGSITLVDQITLLSIIDLLQPKRILEIGTYQGYTTRLLLNNTNTCRVVTVDLPRTERINELTVDQQRVRSDASYNDDYLKTIQNISGELYLEGISQEQAARLELIKRDSTELDFLAEIGEVDFAFIDGGHSYEVILNDTEGVRSCMKKGVIVWHDFGSNIHSDVTRYLNDYAKENQIFYVSGGLCAFQIIHGE